MTIVVLPEFGGQLFTLDEAFKGSGKAQAFVESWRKGIMMLPANRAAARVFFAIVGSPCLREHILPSA